MNHRHLLFFFLLAACTAHDISPTAVTQKTPEPFVATYIFSDLAKDSSFNDSEIVCKLNDLVFWEASGIAASHINTGMFYLEEDSGNPNQIQLIDQTCSIAAVYTIGPFNRDWEDIAVAPGPVAGVSYVYLADIGDNELRYPTKFVYRFPEPSLAGKNLPVNETITSYDRIELKLPDGVFNAETLMVDPLTKDIYVVSKDNTASVYVAPYPQDVTKVVTMRKVAVLPFTKMTGGDISPDGNEMVMKTTQFICYWKKTGNESIEELLKKQPTLLPYTIEPQGEAICFASDGAGYYTVSERLDPAADQPLYFYSRK